MAVQHADEGDPADVPVELIKNPRGNETRRSDFELRSPEREASTHAGREAVQPARPAVALARA